MDVRRLVPFVGKFGGFGHPSVVAKCPAHFPGTEIREGDDGVLGDSHDFPEDQSLIPYFGKGPVENRIIKAVVRKGFQRFEVQFLFDDGNVPFDAAEDVGKIFLDTDAGHFFLFPEGVYQKSIAGT